MKSQVPENLRGNSMKSTEKKMGFFFFWERKDEERLEKERNKFRLCAGSFLRRGPQEPLEPAEQEVSREE